jgi:group I intron endonuclease
MMKKVTGIYYIKHKPSGACYVGQSQDINSRWNAHRNHLERGEHHSQKLQKCWYEDGENSFEFIIVDIVPNGLNHLEIQRWLIRREKEEYEKLKQLGLAFNTYIPAIVVTENAKKVYQEEKKKSAKENNKKVSAERERLKNVHRALLNHISEVRLERNKLVSELEKAKVALRPYVGIRGIFGGRSYSNEACDIKCSISKIEKQISAYDARIAKLELDNDKIKKELRELFNKYSGVVERKVNRLLVRSGISLPKITR